MDRSRILAVASGVMVAGVLATGSAAAAEPTGSVDSARYGVQVQTEASAAGGDLSINEVPCCV
ncbi:hypothetical protein ABZY19_35555 [Streptomyces sp. NPDC006475]|uniref:hypothetical protein n=1 Tax=Streptomyces sp. NPDC006475 TaxID=3155719 RepID=UPI0033A6DB3D